MSNELKGGNFTYTPPTLTINPPEVKTEDQPTTEKVTDESHDGKAKDHDQD
jgi:hypothetical protein